MSWHVDERVWEAYVGGRLDQALELSVDSHVARCAECRAAARGYAPAATADATWAAVRATITTPTLPAPLRLLRRLGMRGDDLVVVSAADSLLVPWAVAVGFAAACACVVGFAGLDPENQDAAFLAMAPLVPVLAVVASYATRDATRQLGQSAPRNTAELVRIRPWFTR